MGSKKWVWVLGFLWVGLLSAEAVKVRSTIFFENNSYHGDVIRHPMGDLAVKFFQDRLGKPELPEKLSPTKYYPVPSGYRAVLHMILDILEYNYWVVLSAKYPKIPGQPLVNSGEMNLAWFKSESFYPAVKIYLEEKDQEIKVAKVTMRFPFYFQNEKGNAHLEYLDVDGKDIFLPYKIEGYQAKRVPLVSRHNGHRVRTQLNRKGVGVYRLQMHLLSPTQEYFSAIPWQVFYSAYYFENPFGFPWLSFTDMRGDSVKMEIKFPKDGEPIEPRAYCPLLDSSRSTIRALGLGIPDSSFRFFKGVARSVFRSVKDCGAVLAHQWSGYESSVPKW